MTAATTIIDLVALGLILGIALCVVVEAVERLRWRW
jgi:hypothetical protein